VNMRADPADDSRRVFPREHDDAHRKVGVLPEATALDWAGA
jgi:hypothetical protein